MKEPFSPQAMFFGLIPHDRLNYAAIKMEKCPPRSFADEVVLGWLFLILMAYGWGEDGLWYCEANAAVESLPGLPLIGVGNFQAKTLKTFAELSRNETFSNISRLAASSSRLNVSPSVAHNHATVSFSYILSRRNWWTFVRWSLMTPTVLLHLHGFSLFCYSFLSLLCFYR